MTFKQRLKESFEKSSYAYALAQLIVNKDTSFIKSASLVTNDMDVNMLITHIQFLHNKNEEE